MSGEIAKSKPEQVALADDGNRRLTRAEFTQLAELPPEHEWFASIENPNTRRAYQNDLREFIEFIGIQNLSEFRQVKRGHVLAWDKQNMAKGLADSTRRRKLSAISSLLNFLCDANAIENNLVKGMKRPKRMSQPTMTLGDDSSKALLNAPTGSKLKAVRDRAILSTFLFHGLRVSELTSLRVDSRVLERDVPHFRIIGKGSKERLIPIHPDTQSKISDYLEAAGHASDKESPLFLALRSGKPLSQPALYKMIKQYALSVGLDLKDCNHALRKASATNALENGADIAKVQEWLGHEDISTTRVYDGRETKPEQSPTFKVEY